MTKKDTAETGTPEVAPNTNLDMWGRLMPTNPKFTKQFKGAGGFSGTALNAMYVIQKLTEEFGPCGQGWRFVLEEDRIQAGHTLKNGDTAKLHIIRGHIEYRIPTDGDWEGAQWFSTGPQFGQTMLVGENKYGTYTDEEAPKKSITDCIGKCAASLGIGADIFLGLFDDNKYINQRKLEEAEAAPSIPQDLPPRSAQAPELTGNMDQGPISDDDMAVARQVYTLCRRVAEEAKDVTEINECLKNNAASLKTLERASKVNFDKLKAFVEERRKALAQDRSDMNDELTGL